MSLVGRNCIVKTVSRLQRKVKVSFACVDFVLFQDLCTQQGGALAGNYGFAGRRASRGLRPSQGTSPSGSEQSALEVMEQRLAQVEQELVDTKAEVKGLRGVVEKLSSLQVS